jgi:NAD(P)-dependent dehydrogenase (short-subunit alcohol dehydrogenase family)
MDRYRPSNTLLSGRVILITGAGAGIGRTVAMGFAEHGAQVILLGRTQSRLEQVYDEIEKSGWPQAAVLPLDLATATPESFEAAADAIEKEFGRLDGLLHNAATLGTLTPLEHYNPETWARVFQVIVHAPWLLTRACLPLLKRSQDASIVFTSADVGRKGRAYWGAYGVSCFAVEGMMQILADELTNSHIRVNSLDPGTVRTALRARAYPAEDPTKWPTAETILPAYLYLMGPDSKGTTGQAIQAQPE